MAKGKTKIVPPPLKRTHRIEHKEDFTDKDFDLLCEKINSTKL